MVVCLTMAIALSVVLSQSASRQTQNYLATISSQESHVVALVSKEIEYQFDIMLADICILTQLNELQNFVQTGNAHLLDDAANEFLVFAQSKPNYLQLRYLDASGHERIRIDADSGLAYKVEKGQLQDKSGRAYFQQGRQLSPGQVFFSPLDLNVENGEIAVPYQPTIRAVMPVYRQGEEQPAGMVVLNYDGKKLDRLLKRMEKIAENTLLLTNADGYWLRGLSRDDEWGFVLPERRDKNMATRFPDVWRQLQLKSGEIRTHQGFFCYRSIDLCQKDFVINAPCWHVISYIPDTAISLVKTSAVKHQFHVGIALFLFGLIPAWIVSLFIAEIFYKYQDFKMKANYDRLTGLANRVLFTEHLEQLIYAGDSNHSQFAVLYCDLDGFKAVNDTLGHDAGDELLIRLGQQMKELVRKTDTVARVGGDEFVILLADVSGGDVVEKIATKIVDQLHQPVELKAGTAQIGVSIGISLYPDDARDKNTLLSCADQAMYKAKRQGKCCYCRYTDMNITTE